MSVDTVTPQLSEEPEEEVRPRHREEESSRIPPRFVPPLAILAGLLLGLLLGGVHYVVQPPKYNAVTLVTVVAGPDNRTGPRALDSLGQIRWSQALARMAILPQVAGPELTKAGQAEKAPAPNKTITVSAAPDTAVFTVTAQDRDAGRAQAAADAVAQAAADVCVSRGLPVRAAFIPAVQPAAPVPGLTIRLVLGVVVGFGAAIVFLLARADRHSY